MRKWLYGWMVAALAASTAFGTTLTVKSPVLLVGDSMMKLPGMAMEKELSKTPDVTAFSFSGIGTGLARLDAFDWLDMIQQLVTEHQPKVAVVSLGANDKQPMQAEGAILQPGTPEWNAEYARRVGEAMDILIKGGCVHVIWLELPPMREEALQTFAQFVNETIRAEAAKRPEVIAYDFSPLVVHRKTKGYTDRVIDPRTAASIKIRDADGIHLTPDGARILSSALMKEFWN